MGTIDYEKRAAITQLGPWEKDIRVSDDYSTNPESQPQARANYILQFVSQMFNGKLSGIRIADLGCNEADISIEFAAQGAHVVALDGRESNLVRPRLIKKILGLDNLEIVKDNVMSFQYEKYGQFDVILCFGLLYHLDDPNRFLKSISEMTKSCLFLNTHVAVPGKSQPHVKEKRLTRLVFDENVYWGKYFEEHTNVPDEDRLRATPRASVHNPLSVWLTKHSLVSMLENVGFTYVLDDIRWNRVISRFDDTVLFLCCKLSYPLQPITCPNVLSSFDRVRPMCTNTVDYLKEEEELFRSSAKPFGYETRPEALIRKLKENLREGVKKFTSAW
jgi:SAM-dependent methyltransferase